MLEIQSLKDYLSITCSEINAAVSNVPAKPAYPMKVSSVRLKLEGEADSIPEELKIYVTESAVSTELETRNWEFEILMSPGPLNGLDYKGPFGELALDAIQGIGTKWKNKLESWKITTIQELAGLEKKDLIRLGGTGSIGRLLEFQLRARLASSPVPDGLKPSKLDPVSIYDCARMTAESLFKAAGPDSLSANASDKLENYLSILITVIDDKVLQKKTIADLRL